MVNDFVNDEIENSEVAEEITILTALLLVMHQNRLDFPFIKLTNPLLLLFAGVGRTIAGNQTEHGVLQINSIAKLVDLYPIRLGLAEQVVVVGELDDVPCWRPCARYHETLVQKERHLFDYPFVALHLLEFAPLVGREESVAVFDVKILAEETKHLGFGSKGIVTNHKYGGLDLDLHV